MFIAKSVNPFPFDDGLVITQFLPRYYFTMVQKVFIRACYVDLHKIRQFYRITPIANLEFKNRCFMELGNKHRKHQNWEYIKHSPKLFYTFWSLRLVIFRHRFRLPSSSIETGRQNYDWGQSPDYPCKIRVIQGSQPLA